MLRFVFYIICMSGTGFITSVTTQIPTLTRTCLPQESHIRIDLKKMEGQWYEVEATPNYMEYAFKCISIRLGAFWEKNADIQIDAVNRLTKESGLIAKVVAKIPVDSNQVDGKLHLSVAPISKPDGGESPLTFLREQYKELNVTILAADYNKWALIYTCKKHGTGKAHTSMLWVLARDQELDPEAYAAIRLAKTINKVDDIKTRETLVGKCHSHQHEGLQASGPLTISEFIWS